VNSVLVTGGAGYIGSHTCKALSRAGYAPVTYDNLVHGHEWAVKWGPLEKGDILDTSRLSEVISAYKPSAVVHFAAFAYVGESVEDPAKYYRNNVAGTLSLLDAMRQNGVNKLSSQAHVRPMACQTRFRFQRTRRKIQSIPTVPQS